MLPLLSRALCVGLTALAVCARLSAADAPPAGATIRLINNLTPDELTHVVGGLDDKDGLNVRLSALTLPGDLARVTADLPLPPQTPDGYTYRWWSSNIEVIGRTGKVTRPRTVLGNATVVLKAFLRKGDVEAEKIFTVTVLKEDASPAPTFSTAFVPVQVETEADQLIAQQWSAEFQPVTYPKQKLDFVVDVAAGESIQNAIEKVKAAGGGVVRLGPGVHPLTASVVVCDGLTLVGAGRDYTLLKKTADFADTTIRHSGGALRDVVLKDFTLDGDGRTGQGINFSSISDDPATQTNRILLQNITVRNVFDHGVHMKRMSNLIVDHTRLMYNGNHGELFHNIYLLGINNLLISDCDFSSPTAGKCLKLTRVKNAIVQRTDLRDGLWNGVQVDDVARQILFHKVHFENLGRTALWCICERFGKAETRYTRDPLYSPQNVIINRCTVVGNTRGAVFKDVRNVRILNSEFRNREADVITLRCADQIQIQGSSLSKPPAHFTAPEDVPIL